MKSRTLIICSAMFTLLLSNCSELPVSGSGGSSETINAKVIIIDSAATVIDDNHGNSSGLVMEVFSTIYRPYEKTGFAAKIERGKTAESITLPTGVMYNFLIYSQEKDLSCFIQNKLIQKGDKDTIPCVLSSECTVNGKLVTQNDQVVNKKYVVSIMGSPFICITDETQAFTFGAIPRGSFTLSVRPKEQRLFIANANYEFNIDEVSERTRLKVVLP